MCIPYIACTKFGFFFQFSSFDFNFVAKFTFRRLCKKYPQAAEITATQSLNWVPQKNDKRDAFEKRIKIINKYVHYNNSLSIMVLSLINKSILSAGRIPVTTKTTTLQFLRWKTHSRNGTVLPMPKVLPFGLFGVLCSVIPGLFIGAAISKSVANFLEENELFVPSDDDDDED